MTKLFSECISLINLFTNNDNFEWKEHPIIYIIIVIIEGILDSMIIIGLIELIMFHIYINWKQISTYEWILIQREKQNIKKQETLKKLNLELKNQQ